MGIRDFTLWSVIERNARWNGARTAFVFDERPHTHAEYAARALHLAAGLVRAGLRRGDRVAVVAQNRPEFLDLLAAAARLGAIVVPVNWRLSPEEMAHAVTDTTPKLLLADPEYQPALAALRERCPGLLAMHGYDRCSDGFTPYEALLDAGERVDAPRAEAGDGFVIIHTAAVGGLPRGALLSHAGLLAAGMQLINRWQLGPDDVGLGMLPLFHVSGLGQFLAMLQAGGKTLVSARFDPRAAARQIAEHRVTVLSEFAPMLGAILDAAADEGADLSSLRAVSGLDTPETIARFHAACPRADFWSGYGQSEVSGMATLARFRERPGAAGRPALLTEVAVVDERDALLPPGRSGEIVVRGPTVFLGYWNREDDTREAFRNGWHHTGDLGRFDDDGYLWFEGRTPAKELIKPGGENVYPAEVERVLLEHPAIAEAVVFGVADAEWGEAVRAVCVCREGLEPPHERDVIEFVGARIARFKKPKRVIFASELPRGAGGAPDRMAIRKAHGGD
jgi:long-chain acyl-CoA synthetase